jgi:hypothetical protein
MAQEFEGSGCSALILKSGIVSLILETELGLCIVYTVSFVRDSACSTLPSPACK